MRNAWASRNFKYSLSSSLERKVGGAGSFKSICSSFIIAAALMLGHNRVPLLNNRQAAKPVTFIKIAPKTKGVSHVDLMTWGWLVNGNTFRVEIHHGY
jgi:hypothetical protein